MFTSRRVCLPILIISVIMALGISACHAVVYVKADAPGPTHDGNSWATPTSLLLRDISCLNC